MYGWATDEFILRLWRAGKDTKEIASATWEHESHIANRLPAILLHARQDQEWDRRKGRAE